MEQQEQQVSDDRSGAKWPIIIIALVIIATVGAAAYFWNHPSPGSKAKEKGAYMFTYSSLDNFSLKGTKNGSRMSFAKPQQYKLVYSAPNNDQASFRHSLVNGQQHPNIGGIDVAESLSSKTISDKDAQLYAAALATPSNKNYAVVLKPIQAFMTGRLGSTYDIKLDAASPFHSKYVIKNAWSWQFSASPKKQAAPKASSSATKAPFDTTKSQPVPKNVQSTPGLLNYKGKVVMIIGNNTYYYFLVYNTNYNWDNNSAVWDNVLNSLGTDQ